MVKPLAACKVLTGIHGNSSKAIYKYTLVWWAYFYTLVSFSSNLLTVTNSLDSKLVNIA